MLHRHLIIQNFRTEEVLFRAELEVFESSLVPTSNESIFIDGKWYRVRDVCRYYKNNELSKTLSITVWVSDKYE